MRIVSLLPSATEIVVALGAQNDLVGISHECDFPSEITQLPRVTRAHIDSEASSKSIHTNVADRLNHGLSLYEVDREALETLKPDVILTQDQCSVCAVSLAQVESAVQSLTQTETRVCSLQPHSLKDVSESFLQVGATIGRFDQAVRLSREFWSRLNELGRAPVKSRPKVLCIEWLEPLMIAGHWTPELVTIGGGDPLIVTKPGPFATVTADQILAAQPDIVFVMPCGFSLKRVQTEVAQMDQTFWKALDDITAKRIFLVDGNALFNRSGPRLLDSAEILSGVIRMDAFLCFKHLAHFKKWSPQ